MHNSFQIALKKVMNSFSQGRILIGIIQLRKYILMKKEIKKIRAPTLFQLPFLVLHTFSQFTQLCLTLCDPMGNSLPGFAVHGNFSGNNTGMGCHLFPSPEDLIFLTQGSNLSLLHSRRILYLCTTWEDPEGRLAVSKKHCPSVGIGAPVINKRGRGQFWH